MSDKIKIGEPTFSASDANYVKPETITIPIAEYEAMRLDAERYRYCLKFGFPVIYKSCTPKPDKWHAYTTALGKLWKIAEGDSANECIDKAIEITSANVVLNPAIKEGN
jgi:hypothetical protein